MKCFILLGSTAELISALPIAQHECETSGKPVFLVRPEHAPILDRVPFVHAVTYDGESKDALKFAKQQYDDVVDLSCDMEHRQSSWQLDQWERADCLHLWNKLPLTIKHGMAILHWTTPVINLADDATCPFRDELYKDLVEEFPHHQVLRIDSPHKLMASLPQYDAADLIVCCETKHLHLSRASSTPVIALAQDGWTGSAPAKRFAFYAHYREFPKCKERLLEAARNAINPPPRTSSEPTAIVVYIHVPGDEDHVALARQFVDSFLKYPPGYPCKLLVVCQGVAPTKEMSALFNQIPDASYTIYSDHGWDIGAFIAMARIIKEDVMVCMGGTAYLQRAGWLKRMMDVWHKHGPGYYGSFATYEISPHMNTSGFWCSPTLLEEYPINVRSKAQRYEFEHGFRSLWRLCAANGVKVKMCTWEGEYDWTEWRYPPNVYRRGDQTNCLTLFRHSARYEAAPDEAKVEMSRLADTMVDNKMFALKQEHDSKQPLKIVVVYVYPVMGGEHDALAKRFVDSYTKYFPETSHDLVVVSNGGKPTMPMLRNFLGLRRQFLEHDDSGWDIGAYRKAAREIACDLMVFFGGASYLRGKRWLERMVEAYRKHGDSAIFGCTGSLGHNIHLRTTGFFCDPKLLMGYPHQTTSAKESRYEFEHGKDNFTVWCMKRGLKALVVTWNGEFSYREWDGIPNGFHRGDQSAIMCGDRLTAPPYWPVA